MTKFDLKKIIAENKATFFSSLDEGKAAYAYEVGKKEGEEIEKEKLKETSGNKAAIIKTLSGYYEIPSTDFEKFKLDGTDEDTKKVIEFVASQETPFIKKQPLDQIKKDIEGVIEKANSTEPSSEDVYPTRTYAGRERDPRMDEEKTTMTKEALKTKIKEMILAELNEETINIENPASEDTFYNESKIAENTKITKDQIQKKYNEMFGKNPQTKFADVAKALGTTEQEIAAALFSLPMFEAKKEDEEATDAPEATDIEVSAEETPTSDSFEVSTSEVDPTIKAIQDALTQAQAAAQKLGDEKLTDQIGNTITFFTRTHVANKDVAPVAEQLDEAFINKLKHRAGIIK
jgi:hypothetical protein